MCLTGHDSRCCAFVFRSTSLTSTTLIVSFIVSVASIPNNYSVPLLCDDHNGSLGTNGKRVQRLSSFTLCFCPLWVRVQSFKSKSGLFSIKLIGNSQDDRICMMTLSVCCSPKILLSVFSRNQASVYHTYKLGEKYCIYLEKRIELIQRRSVPRKNCSAKSNSHQAISWKRGAYSYLKFLAQLINL